MSRDAAEAAAREVRQSLRLGDEPFDVLRGAHALGALVVLSPIEDGPQGMFALRGSDAWVYVNTFGARALLGRLRFTVAHELGHWRLGHGSRIDDEIDLRAQGGEEADANAFAAELLAPQASLERIAGRFGAPDLELLVSIAARFGVSCQTALHRLDYCNMVTPHQKRALTTQLERGAHRIGDARRRQLEFVDQLSLQLRSLDDTTTRPPEELLHRVETLWESGVLSDQEAGVLTRISEASFLNEMHERGATAAETPPDDDWW